MEHAESGVAWALAIQHSAAGHYIRESAWLYPWLNTLHVVGMALLLGAVAVLDLRLVGLFRAGRPADAAAITLPLAKLGFALAVPTGLGLFIAEANGVVTNWVFLVKFAAIAVALANIAIFHRGRFRDIERWSRIPAAARAAAAVSLLAWLIAAICGRYAAYV